MFRRFLVLSVGGLALLAVLGAPGQLHAQRMRGGGSHGALRSFHGGAMPGFRRGFAPRFNRRSFGPRFDRRFNRGFFFDPQFDSFGHRRSFGPRFDRRFNRGFFDPRFSPGFRPGFFMP